MLRHMLIEAKSRRIHSELWVFMIHSIADRPQMTSSELVKVNLIFDVVIPSVSKDSISRQLLANRNINDIALASNPLSVYHVFILGSMNIKLRFTELIFVNGLVQQSYLVKLPVRCYVDVDFPIEPLILNPAVVERKEVEEAICL